jgi:hypothetical protein
MLLFFRDAIQMLLASQEKLISGQSRRSIHIFPQAVDGEDFEFRGVSDHAFAVHHALDTWTGVCKLPNPDNQLSNPIHDVLTSYDLSNLARLTK